MTSISNNIAINEESIKKTVVPALEGLPNSKGDVSILALIFLYLVEATSTACRSSLLKAKELQENALSQERVNNVIGQEKWNNVPSDHIVKKWVTISKNRHVRKPWSGSFWTKKNWVYYTYDRKRMSVVANQASIQVANSKNEAVQAQRQALESKLAILQQEASVNGQYVNVAVNDSTQFMTISDKLLSIVQDLTFKAMLTSPPKGAN